MSAPTPEQILSDEVKEPVDPLLGIKGEAEIHVEVVYDIHPDGRIDTAWFVDTSKAQPSVLPMWMYW